jgi:acetyl-CoA carboxylase, biotin carboxylase subunit
VRDDSGVYEGCEVPVHYDPLVSKLIVWARDRRRGHRRMRRAIAEYRIVGIRTTLPFFARVLDHPDFLAGEIDTSFVERVLASPRGGVARSIEIAVTAAAVRAFEERQAARVDPGGPGAWGPAWRAAGLREAHASRLGCQG